MKGKSVKVAVGFLIVAGLLLASCVPVNHWEGEVVEEEREVGEKAEAEVVVEEEEEETAPPEEEEEPITVEEEAEGVDISLVGLELGTIGPPKACLPPLPSFIPEYIDLMLTLDATNSYSSNVTIDIIYYEILIDGHYAGHGAITNDYNVPGNNSETIELLYTVESDTADGILIEAISSGIFHVAISGTASANYGSEVLDLEFQSEFNYEGEPIACLPSITIYNVTIPSEVEVGEPFTYIVTLENSQSSSVVVTLKGSSSATGEFLNETFAIAANDETVITREIYCITRGTRTISFSLYYESSQLDSWSSSLNVIATYTYILSTSVTPSGAGSVSLSPSSGNYTSGTSVTLTATPESDYAFDRWSGNASGSSSTITITMDSDKSVVAHFSRVTYTYTLSTSVTPSGAGSVSLSPSSDNYTSGTSVTLTATPESDYAFDHWSGDATTGWSESRCQQNPVTITMSSDKSIVAHFSRTYTYEFTVPRYGEVILVKDLDLGEIVAGSFTISGYSFLDIRLYVEDPNGNKVIDNVSTGESFHFRVYRSGTYRICFENKPHRVIYSDSRKSITLIININGLQIVYGDAL